MQHEIQELTERVASGADEYKALFRKYTLLQQNMQPNTHEEDLFSLVRNAVEIQQAQDKETTLLNSSSGDSVKEVRECPMCYWPFPPHLTLEAKREHIDNHFI